MKKRAGFTLIEMLVVISIIGMLASIMLAALSNAKKRGKIGAVVLFESHLSHSYGADSPVYFNFNALDSSAPNQFPINLSTTNKVSYTIRPPGGSISYISDGPLGGRSLVTNNGSLVGTFVPPLVLTGPELTVSMWIKPTEFADANLIYVNGTNGIVTSLTLNGENLMFIGGGGVYGTGASRIDSSIGINLSIPSNAWSHIAYSVNSTGGGSFYQDGKKLGTYPSPIGWNFAPSAVTIEIGNALTAVPSYNYPFKGYINNVGVYTRYLADTDIRDIYLAGLADHKNIATK